MTATATLGYQLTRRFAFETGVQGTWQQIGVEPLIGPFRAFFVALTYTPRERPLSC